MPVIVGVPRSGTTLLRFMLDAHPALAIPPETGFLIPLSELAKAGDSTLLRIVAAMTQYPADAPTWPDFQLQREVFQHRLSTLDDATPAAAARCFYRLYAERQGKTRWGDKTPSYGGHIVDIQALLPEAHFIHLIRDGRDVALSLREQWFSPARDIETLASHWRDMVSATRAQASACQHYLELRYEDLVRDTVSSVKTICAFIGLEFHPLMLQYFERSPQRLQEHGPRLTADGRVLVTHEQRLRQQAMTTVAPDASRALNWRRAMTRREQLDFAKAAGSLLRDLGYEP